MTRRLRALRGPRSAVVLVAFAAVLVACAPAAEQADPPPDATVGADRDPASPGTGPVSPGPGSASPPSASAALFAFTAPTVTGVELDASVHAGRDVALWFWAPW